MRSHPPHSNFLENPAQTGSESSSSLHCLRRTGIHFLGRRPRVKNSRWIDGTVDPGRARHRARASASRAVGMTRDPARRAREAGRILMRRPDGSSGFRISAPCRSSARRVRCRGRRCRSGRPASPSGLGPCSPPLDPCDPVEPMLPGLLPPMPVPGGWLAMPEPVLPLEDGATPVPLLMPCAAAVPAASARERARREVRIGMGVVRGSGCSRTGATARIVPAFPPGRRWRGGPFQRKDRSAGRPGHAIRHSVLAFRPFCMQSMQAVVPSSWNGGYRHPAEGGADLERERVGSGRDPSRAKELRCRCS